MIKQKQVKESRERRKGINEGKKVERERERERRKKKRKRRKKDGNKRGK